MELSPLSRDLLSFFRVTQVWSYEHTHTYIYIYMYMYMYTTWYVYIYIYIIMYTWKSWSMGFSYRAQPAQPGLQSSTRKCNCDHQRTPDCGHGSLTTLSWSCWLMIAFISCYIIFDDLWWSLMIFDDLWLLYFVSYFILFLSIHLKKRVQSPSLSGASAVAANARFCARAQWLPIRRRRWTPWWLSWTSHRRSSHRWYIQ